jgi:hypothetical protein
MKTLIMKNYHLSTSPPSITNKWIENAKNDVNLILESANIDLIDNVEYKLLGEEIINSLISKVKD